MNIQAAQIWGMMRYEFKQHWRRRAMLVITLAMLVIVNFSALVMRNGEIAQLFDAAAQQGVLNQTDVIRAATVSILFATWAVVGVTLALVLPIVLADTIPLDQQYGVRELMDSLPLSTPTYLAGKLLGAWAAAVSATVVVMLVTGVVWRLLVGSYDFMAYLQMWLLGGTSLVILNGGLGVLVAAGQPTRGRAVVVMILFLVVPLLLASRSFDAREGFPLLGYINPMRAAIIMRYANFDVTQSFSYLSSDVVVTIIVGIAELAIVWLLLTTWLRLRENQQ